MRITPQLSFRYRVCGRTTHPATPDAPVDALREGRARERTLAMMEELRARVAAVAPAA